MKPIPLYLYTALLAATAATAAPLDSLPAGLYRESGNTTTTFSNDRGQPPQPPLSPGFAPTREVCVPADSGAWYEQQLARFPQEVTAEMRSRGVIRVALNARMETNREGMPEVWFGYSEDSRYADVVTHRHSNWTYTYLNKPCSE
ncbi:hypothetical protein L1281_002098 [Neisseria sp. HSC-16F19]|nr:hypothetical protein [Neisseria sp. HSC-16F19]MCP2041498.1 hypothetical protein [Neisseria sp. HSC-16F19]